MERDIRDPAFKKEVRAFLLPLVPTDQPGVFNAALMELAVYCLHVCVALFGMPEKLMAGASHVSNGTEAAGTMLLDYGGQQTTISYSKVTSSVNPSIVQGELGTLVFDTLNQPSYLRMLYRDGRTE
jgi:predicted dehydrogenase